MIKFHYHRARADVPRLGIERGDLLCHVYSDESREELLEWGRRNDLRAGWIDERNDLPHFDLHGERLARCGDGIGRREFVEDLRAWRKRAAAERAEAGPAEGGGRGSDTDGIEAARGGR